MHVDHYFDVIYITAAIDWKAKQTHTYYKLYMLVDGYIFKYNNHMHAR